MPASVDVFCSDVCLQGQLLGGSVGAGVMGADVVAPLLVDSRDVPQEISFCGGSVGAVVMGANVVASLLVDGSDVGLEAFLIERSVGAGVMGADVVAPLLVDGSDVPLEDSLIGRSVGAGVMGADVVAPVLVDGRDVGLEGPPLGRCVGTAVVGADMDVDTDVNCGVGGVIDLEKDAQVQLGPSVGPKSLLDGVRGPTSESSETGGEVAVAEFTALKNVCWVREAGVVCVEGDVVVRQVLIEAGTIVSEKSPM